MTHPAGLIPRWSDRFPADHGNHCDPLRDCAALGVLGGLAFETPSASVDELLHFLSSYCIFFLVFEVV